MGLATIIHWDKFNHRHVAFWLWALLYFTTPLLVLWTWWTNRSFEPPSAEDGLQLPSLAARATAAVGGLALLVGLFLFTTPSTAIRIMLTLIILAGLRAHSELDPRNPITWLFAVGFVGLTAAMAVLYWRLERVTRGGER
jgi:hypothetical protein